MGAFGNYIVQESDVDNWPAGTELDAQLTIIKQAESLIEHLTHDFFYVKDFDVLLDGNGKDQLTLGLMPDILSVTQILIAEEELDADLWRYDTDAVYYNPGLFEGDPEVPYVLFPKGTRNIEAIGTYGWTTCPFAIKKAAMILCQVENDPTLYSHYNDFMSERLGDASISLGTKTFGRAFISGITEVDKLIRQYIRNKPMMGAS